jgi:N12 class adenine-specific DNA methylase
MSTPKKRHPAIIQTARHILSGILSGISVHHLDKETMKKAVDVSYQIADEFHSGHTDEALKEIVDAAAGISKAHKAAA